MTNREWLSAMCGRLDVSAQDVDLIIVNQGINPDDTLDLRKVKTALCNEFATIIPMANISEGGMSVTWNMEGIKIWYKQMCNELGIVPAGSPRVHNASNRW